MTSPAIKHAHLGASRALLLGALSLGLALALACSKPPKPKELVDFEAFRVSKDAERLKAFENDEVRQLLEESEAFYSIAIEKYDDEDLFDVKQFSLMGIMKFRTAKALLARSDARQRMSEANDKYARNQDVRNEYNDKRTQVEKTIVILERQKSLLNEKASIEAARALEAEQAAQKAKTSERQLEAQKAIDTARIKRTEAEGIKADQYKESTGDYNRANNSLKGAERFFTEAEYLRASQEADEAIRFFEKSIELAKPLYASEQETVKRDETNKLLFEKAHSTFRDNVKIDGRGMVIIVPSLFKPSKDSIDDAQVFNLDIIGKLIKEYPSYNLLITGHTDKFGNAARNMTLSQARAQSVRDYFLQRGVSSSRMQTAGYGGTQPAFENRGRERFKNNRVEIIFLYNK